MNDDKCPICGTEFRFHSSHAAPGSDCPVLDLGDGAIDAFNARFEMLCRPARAGEEPSIYNIDRTPWFNNKDFWTAWNTVMMLRRQLAEAQAAIAALLLLLKEVHNEPVCLPGTRPGQGILDQLANEKADNERMRVAFEYALNHDCTKDAAGQLACGIADGTNEECDRCGSVVTADEIELCCEEHGHLCARCRDTVEHEPEAAKDQP